MSGLLDWLFGRYTNDDASAVHHDRGPAEHLEPAVDWKVGDRVYVEPEEKGYPFGTGTITAIGDVWRYSDGHPSRHWFDVLLDKPAKRHSSDGEPHREWSIERSALRPA